jgi:excisionase family DNA binding protein
MENSNGIITTVEAAGMLGVSRATVSRMIRRGEIEGYKLTGAQNSPYRVYRQSILEFLTKREGVCPQPS